MNGPKLLSTTSAGQRRIDQLSAAGHRTDWYKRPEVDDSLLDQPVTCGYFSVYILDGDWSYTRTSAGEKYLPFKRLKAPVATPCAYCTGCQKRWPTVAEALTHLPRLKPGEWS